MQNSWKYFIYNRTQNLNRPGSSSMNEDQPSPSKRRKFTNQEKHAYPPLPPLSEDQESFARNQKLLMNEIGKPKANVQILKNLMFRTYERRTEWIRSECPTLTTILEEYPLLKKSSFVSSFVCVNCSYIHITRLLKSLH